MTGFPQTFAQPRGLTQAGLSRINQSIEAFLHCILGAQVNVRSSILGEGGRTKEAQSEFLVVMEDAIRQSDLSQSVQRYQLAVDQAKVRLNLVVCPRCVADARKNKLRKHDRLQLQLATWPIRRGSIKPIFALISLQPFPKVLPVAFKAFVTVLKTTSIVIPQQEENTSE